MTFSRRRYVSNAIELCPAYSLRIVGPYVAEPMSAIRATKPNLLVILCRYD